MPLRPSLALALCLVFAVARADAQDAAAPPPAAVAPPAVPPAPVPDQATLQANYVLIDTINKLRLRPRIAAKIEQSAAMLNQRFELKGDYFKDTDNRVRLQLNLVGAPTSKMLQVCDGKILWEYTEVLGMKRYTKLEIGPVLEKLRDPNLDEPLRASFLNNLGFGGPEALLSGFQGSVTFNQFAEVEVDGVASYKIAGTWVDRTRLVGPNERALPPNAPLPPYVPSDIKLYIDRAQNWPYRIEMLGQKESIMLKAEQQFDPVTHRPIGPRKAQSEVDPTVITLRYTLLPDSEIKPDEQFAFSGPNDAEDSTKGLTDALDRIIAVKKQEKQAKEAAEGAESGTKDPMIELPPTTPTAPTTPVAPAAPLPR